jgi:hypothetical protein
MSNAPEHAEDGELPAVEFRSLGRFAIHNPPAEAAEPDAALEPAPFLLGTHPDALSCDGVASLRSHALALICQARRSLCLYTPDLEPWLYDQRAIAAACRQFLRAHPRNRLRILLGDSRRTVGDGHALLRLARRHTSSCEIRRPHPDYPAAELAYLLVDDCGLLLRNAPQLSRGQACYQAHLRVHQLQRQFDQCWSTSLSDPDLRSFLL